MTRLAHLVESAAAQPDHDDKGILHDLADVQFAASRRGKANGLGKRSPRHSKPLPLAPSLIWNGSERV